MEDPHQVSGKWQNNWTQTFVVCLKTVQFLLGLSLCDICDFLVWEVFKSKSVVVGRLLKTIYIIVINEIIGINIHKS